MYLIIFGKLSILNYLIEEKIHHPNSVLINTDLHHTERGFLEYGGTGTEASVLYI